MKTYLLSIPQRLKQHSTVLDVKAVLCKNAWDTINDEGQTQVMIFHNDGSLIVSTNGNVTICDWRIEPLVGTIIISFKDHSDMYNAMMVQNILVLAKDGSNEVISLVDRENRGIIPNRTVHELTAYFDYHDKQIELQIEREKKLKQIQIEQEKQKEWERIQLLSMKQRERTNLTTFCLENKDDICSKYREAKEALKKMNWRMAYLCVSIIMMTSIMIISIDSPYEDTIFVVSLIIFSVFNVYDLISLQKIHDGFTDNTNISALIRTEYKIKIRYLSDSEITSIARQTLGMDF